MSVLPLPQDIEKARTLWAMIARKNGWYKEPFFVQVWVDEFGQVTDSVSHCNLGRDYILNEDDCPVMPE